MANRESGTSGELLAEIQRLQAKNALLEKENAAWKDAVNRQAGANDAWSVHMDSRDCLPYWYNKETKKSIPYYEAVVKLRDTPTSFDIVTRAELEDEERKERERAAGDNSWTLQVSDRTQKKFWFNKANGKSIYEEDAVVVLAGSLQKPALQIFSQEAVKKKVEDHERNLRKRTRYDADTATRIFVRDVGHHLRTIHCVNIKQFNDDGDYCRACLLKSMRHCALWQSSELIPSRCTCN